MGPRDSFAGPDVQHLPNEGRFDERRQLIIMYCERELQMSVNFVPSTTISEAKEIGSSYLLKYLHEQPDGPPDVTIDDDCTEFFPGMI